jgi:hypothetical protein
LQCSLNQGNLKVSSSPNRLERRYRRIQEAVMTNRKPEDVVFEATLSFTLFVVVTAITALLCHLITVALPILESTLFPQARMVTGL